MKGEVIYLYAFDVANEIVMGTVREILENRSFPFEVRTDHTYPKDVPIYRPLAIEMPSEERIFDQPLRIVIRIFDVGVVNVAVRVAFDVAAPLDLLPYHNPKTGSGRPLDALAQRFCGEVCASIRAALVRSSPPPRPEAYTVFCFLDLGGEQDAGAWLQRERRAIAGLLTESAPDLLSADQVEEALRIRRSYFTRDLVVIDWDASLVVELDGYADDVLYILELANLQLEEFRVMDHRLDVHLERAYRDLSRHRGFVGTPRVMLRWLRHFRVDLTKLADEVTHITKFLGDWHLARIYLGAQERFHVQQWRQSVEERLGQLDEVYQVLQAEVSERRMLWLEIAIVICFLVDLLAIFFWKR